MGDFGDCGVLHRSMMGSIDSCANLVLQIKRLVFLFPLPFFDRFLSLPLGIKGRMMFAEKDSVDEYYVWGDVCLGEKIVQLGYIL